MEPVRGPAAIDSTVSLAALADPPSGMSCKVVAIDGPGGAGKSTLAARVARRLGDAPVIHTDDLASWEHPLDWWPTLLEQVLLPLSRQLPARYQRYDWDRQQLAEWHEVPNAEYLIIEGVTASRREFRPYLAVTVWVSTAREECLRRGLARDGQHALTAWRKWQAAEDGYIESEHPDRTSDLVVSGEHGQPWAGSGRPDKTREPQ
jgi:uridine kinase